MSGTSLQCRSVGELQLQQLMPCELTGDGHTHTDACWTTRDANRPHTHCADGKSPVLSRTTESLVCTES